MTETVGQDDSRRRRDVAEDRRAVVTFRFELLERFCWLETNSEGSCNRNA